MSRYEEKAYAKINLTLEIVGRRQDGYHDLESVMQTIDLHDRVILDDSPSPGTLDVRCEVESPDIPRSVASQRALLPQGKGNIAYRAALLMIEEAGYDGGLNVTVRKSIPMAAGLAGGSADAAAVLRGLNQMWSLGFDLEKLKGLARCLGADVPFCLVGGTCVTRGVGDVLEPFEIGVPLHLVLLIPGMVVSTAEVYALYDSLGSSPDRRPGLRRAERMKEALVSGDIRAVGGFLYNDLESATLKKWPIIAEWKRIVSGLPGCVGSIMSGSGPSVYGIMENREQAGKQVTELRRRGMRCAVVESTGGGGL